MSFSSKFIKSREGKILLSIVLGFGLATCFRLVCNGKQCVDIKAAPLNSVQNKVHKVNDKCYSYSLSPASCSANVKTVDF